MIIPGIDLLDGKVVQLVRGKRKAIEIAEAPAEFAGRFSRFPEVQVIDLNAAFGKGDNRETVKKLCGVVKARVGGGIRTTADAVGYIGAGAKKVIVGTKANPEFLGALRSEIGREKIIAAVDFSKGRVLEKGWSKKTSKKPAEVMLELEGLCSEFFCTNVEIEGTMKGFDFEVVKEIKKSTRNRLVVAGGIKSIGEADELGAMGIDCVVGMALYTGRIALNEALLDFGKGNGLLPAVAQDAKSGEVLMLAYMNRAALSETLKSGFATYWSRSRKMLWRKGETSGNLQKVAEARFDCDADAILLKVGQLGSGACHTGAYSCFYRKLEAEKWKCKEN